MPTSLDDLRAAWPSFGFALYAYDPAGSVTAEAIIAEQSIRATGDTAELALDALAAMLMPVTHWTSPPEKAEGEPSDTDPTEPDIFG
jgi:hypothetical protein